MKAILGWMGVIAGVIGTAGAQAASHNGYSVTAPPVFPIYNTSTPGSWAATNGTSVEWLAGGSARAADQSSGYPQALPDLKDRYLLVESAVGSPIEHIQPEYYLGDPVAPPDGVDWSETLTLATNSLDWLENRLFFEPSVPALYFCGGGTITIDWVLQDGSTQTHSYVVGGNARSRPYRIFWTEEPYNAPVVDLTGKFVQFHGDSVLTVPVTGTVTNYDGGMPVETEVVTRGLFVDPATHFLHAYGQIEGQVVMGYYRTGDYDDLLGTIVVEVCRPDITTVEGDIGVELQPVGDGHSPEGLTALVTEGLNAPDDYGAYVYQHKGEHSYSPKAGSIFALRKTIGEPWKIEVYWQEADLMGTSWPFEVLHYECDWPDNAEPYVRGNLGDDLGEMVPISDSYQATVLEYQEPPGHAMLTASNQFFTTDEGYSLLQLEGDDNVWFIPVRSIWRDQPEFDLTPLPWPVGTEVTPLPTSVALDFDGRTAALATGISNALNGSFTLECWFKTTGNGQWQKLLYKNSGPDQVYGLLDVQAEIGPDGQLLVIFGSDQTNVNAASLSGTAGIRYDDDEWRHLALVYSAASSNAGLYVNGQLVDEAEMTLDRPLNHDGGLFFGLDSTQSAAYHFNGQLDDLRVWTAVRTQDEILDSMNGFLHDCADQADLLAYYPIEDRLGRVAHDGTGRYPARMINCIRTQPGAIGLQDLEGFSRYHGFIYEPASGDNYNPDLYQRPDTMTSDSGSTNEPETYIFGVHTQEQPMEVWWAHEVRQVDMPDALWFPARVQRYAMEWPDSSLLPKIVLASQLGSANQSVVPRGACVDFSEAEDSRMRIPDSDWFSRQEYTVECWVHPHSFAQDWGRIFDFNNGFRTNNVKLQLREDGTVEFATQHAGLNRILSSPEPIPAGQWTHVAGVMSNGTAHLYINGREAASDGGFATWSETVTTNNYLAFGIQGTANHSFDGMIDEFRIWNTARSAADIAEQAFTPLSGRENGLELYFNFDADFDPGQTEASYAVDLVNRKTAYITYSEVAWPGAPRLDSGILTADETPTVYAQNDNSAVGYNPNEEHAFVEAANGGYVAYALRCDLNREDTSPPCVLVSYRDPDQGGRPAMKVYAVVPTNRIYADFADTMTAGTQVPGPHPLDYLPNPWMLDTYWEDDGYDTVTVRKEVVTDSCTDEHTGAYTETVTTNWTETTVFSCPGYRDRKGQIWAKNAGLDGGAAFLKMHNFYPLQAGFYIPGSEEQPEVGAPIPWLACLDDPDADPLNGEPVRWTWTVNWPESVPELAVGQTLTEASGGLPEVWDAKSMAVVHISQTNGAVLYDPTAAQSVGLEFEGDFAEYFGFETGSNGSIYTRNGLTFFYNVPPSVSGRFYFDPAAPASSCLKLVGERIEHDGGTSYLQLNVLNEEERGALLILAGAHTNEWREAVEELARTRISTTRLITLEESSSYEITDEYLHRYLGTTWNGYLAIQSEWVTYTNTVHRLTQTPTVDALPVDHYALTALGGCGGYLTLIENDGRNGAGGVNEGDPISMHVIALSSNLYEGGVLPLEDANNLLSEQLDLLYTESFAGTADDYEFEWKRAEPNADGTTPGDYETGYALYRSEEGLTRFTLGRQGDTLNDLVNNFYVLRYRAQPGTPAAELTGGGWSGWIGPTLAEGWVQRVLNNVTPFTQRMQDLYNNETETTVSMLQQAGAPYEGDVALNQDNLEDTGLIQLYQTVLNKAESMSLQLGINNTAANQQLMQAATRLNDMYMLLGNEAFADAMDPTIGFGSDFTTSDNLPLGSVDYGSLHSSLFCFDNQVPTLRDEELALLRGRDAQLAPGTHTSPAFNRLVWNFTKGITAGEVAYAVNYQIFGNDAVIDAPQAAALYPQGHGDAWGHFLSGLYGYYRLMRNPFFSWGTPSITPMMLNDAVVDVDYYDEERFAEAAAALTRTGIEIVSRTCEKQYLEQGDAALAGYIDENTQRAFGYGEWGCRAGLSGLINWAAANSLVPAYEDPRDMSMMTFGTATVVRCLNPVDEIDFASDFTLEFKVWPAAAVQNAENLCYLLDYHPAAGSRSDAGSLSMYLYPGSEKIHLHAADSTANLYADHPAFDTWNHVAVTYDADALRMDFFLDGAPAGTFTNIALPASVPGGEAVIVLGPEDSPDPFQGRMAELRIWNRVRSAEEIAAGINGVSALSDGLLMYQRFLTSLPETGVLPDEAAGATWQAENPVWMEQELAGAALEYVDDSILRIDRSTLGALEELPAAMASIQRQVDQADAGLTSLGLSGEAIPFDIDPAELEAGTSHFEQILSRAEQALGNAEAVLNRAQGFSRLQRQQAQSAANLQEAAANEEAAFTAQLVSIFGYPYSDDIGPGGTYPQGYSGPDLYHYMWMDLEQFGFQEFELEPVESVVHELSAWYFPVENEEESTELTFELAANGMILKPESIAGTRRAQGRLQAAYAGFIKAYQAYRRALLVYEEKEHYFLAEADWAVARAADLAAFEAAQDIFEAKELIELAKQQQAIKLVYELEFTRDESGALVDETKEAVPDIVIAGLAVGTDIGAPIKAAIDAPATAEDILLNDAVTSSRIQYVTSQIAEKRNQTIYSLLKDNLNLVFELHELNAELERLMMTANEAAMALDVAYCGLVEAQENFRTILAEGERILSKRESRRKQTAGHVAAGRYQDMAFRAFQNDALAKYGTTFELAKKYTYLACKAYAYETGLLGSDAYSGDELFREVCGSRSIGYLDNGEPQPAGNHGEGGLADILARLRSNWLVLEGRLGINNPANESCWLSLRRELFRIQPDGEDSEAHWQDTLSGCRVDDLRTHPAYRRWCLPFASTEGLEDVEPGLVIPFSTTIDFARNVFGWPLAAGDHAFDSSRFTTKIRRVGISFTGYNTGPDGSTVSALSSEPRVYLVPVGADIMRAPGGDGSEILMFNVVDQVVPLPFPVGDSEFDQADWGPLFDAYIGYGDPLASIRKYPTLRAGVTDPAEDAPLISDSRLASRSVWNTSWLLIIPAGTLHSDRDFALDALIRGADLNSDGTDDLRGVSDIWLGFDTYSNSGN